MQDLRTGAPGHVLSLTEKLQQFTGAAAKAVETQQLRADARQTEYDEAYKAGVKNDIRMGLGKIAAENPADLEKFQALGKAYIDGVVGESEDQVRSDISLIGDGLFTSYAEQIQGNEIKANKENARKELGSNVEISTQDAQRLMRNGDKLAAGEAMLDAYESLDAQVESGSMLKADAEKLKTDVAQSVAEQSFMTDIDAAETADEAYDVIDGLAEKTPQGWSPDSWQSFLGKAQTEVNRRAKREAQDAKLLADQEEQNALVQRGANILDNGYPIDPNKTTDESKYDLESVNAYYDTQAQQWANLPPNEQINKNVEFVNKSGVIPLNLETRMNAFTRSGGPEQVLVASEVYGRIQETSPQALRDLPAETKAILSQVNDAQKSGTDIALAADAARMAAYGTTAAQREEIKIKSAEFNKNIDSTLQGYLDKDYDPGFFGDEPDAPPAMQAEYKVTFDRYMLLTNGDSDQSGKLAYSDLTGTWGVSRVGGDKRFMKYAPEAVYHIEGVDDSWVQDQFDADLAAYPDAQISIDPSTARNKRPEYAVFVPNEVSGVLEPIFDENNRPLVWQPDFTQTDDYSAMVEAPGKAVEKAKRQRDVNLQRKANSLTNAVNAYMRSSGFDAMTSISNMESLGKLSAADANNLRGLYAAED